MIEAATRGKRKVLSGVVRKVSSAKTISVLVTRRVRHPVYGKYITRSKGYLVHDENQEAKVGDKVHIMATRAMSATKRWRLVDIEGKTGSKAEVVG